MSSTSSKAEPGLRFTTVLLAAVSLSIGWGIRGNFGHEYGAMIPGALTAIAVCLMSGREDWRDRVAYFAMFGALGWGFGGSISYMQVISYTHSGHLPTQAYGFAGLFVIGFLWAGLGGAATAFPAVVDRDRLTRIFRPLLFIFAVWMLWSAIGERVIKNLVEDADGTGNRHKYPTYWFDSDWTAAFTALIAVCLYDLWDRRSMATAKGFAIYSLLGAALGWIGKELLDATGSSSAIARTLTHKQGDLDLFRRAAEVGINDPSFTEHQRALLEKFGGDLEAFRAALPSNWPAFLYDYPAATHHLGWVLGLMAGAALYFARRGQFRDDSRLFVYMSLGWLVSFLVFPVLLGLRMTPPRGDDWAGILGVLVGTILYCLRYGLAPVAYASLVSGTVGGVGFSGAALIKLFMLRWGNPQVVTDPERVAAWAHWQSANWHSFLEQTYGFINGIGIALAMALLARRVGAVNNQPRERRWTGAFAVAFVLLFLVYVNWSKAVETWIDQKTVPATMRMPLFESVEMSSQNWFALVYWIVAAGVVLLLVLHLRKPLALIPSTALGKGQLLYIAFLWVCVIFNNERALTGFSEGRLITEGVIFVNAIFATVLLLAFSRSNDRDAQIPSRTLEVPYARAAFAGLLLFVAVGSETLGTRLLYGDHQAGGSRPQLRLGPDAEWRINPLLMTGEHN